MDLNKTTLSEQIYQILKEDILTQRIPLGEKLTLKMLKERFEVSSTPIRDALTRLTEEGACPLLFQYRRQCHQPRQNRPSGAVPVYGGSRCPGHSLQFQIERPFGDFKGAGRKHWADQSDSGEKLTQEETSLWISHSDRFHLIFYDYCHNTRLAVAAGRLRSQLTIFSNAYETGSLPQTTIFRAHEEIFSLYKERHFQEAADRMRLHLEESLQFALEALDSMAE